MTIASVSSALARIASIQSRFAPQGFAGVLHQASVAPGGAALTGPTPLPAASNGTWAAAPSAVDSPQAGGASRGALGARPLLTGGSEPGWVERLPVGGRPWADAIDRAAGDAGVDPALLSALVWAESNFDAGAVSTAGARGLAQLMPATARELGVDIADPASNLAGGAAFLRAQLDRFGQVDLALAAYNAGPARVAQAGGIPAIAETRAYVPRVLGYYARLQGAS